MVLLEILVEKIYKKENENMIWIRFGLDLGARWGEGVGGPGCVELIRTHVGEKGPFVTWCVCACDRIILS